MLRRSLVSAALVAVAATSACTAEDVERSWVTRAQAQALLDGASQAVSDAGTLHFSVEQHRSDDEPGGTDQSSSGSYDIGQQTFAWAYEQAGPDARSTLGLDVVSGRDASYVRAWSRADPSACWLELPDQVPSAGAAVDGEPTLQGLQYTTAPLDLTASKEQPVDKGKVTVDYRLAEAVALAYPRLAGALSERLARTSATVPALVTLDGSLPTTIVLRDDDLRDGLDAADVVLDEAAEAELDQYAGSTVEITYRGYGDPVELTLPNPHEVIPVAADPPPRCSQ